MRLVLGLHLVVEGQEGVHHFDLLGPILRW